MSIRKTTEEFVKKAKQLHGNKYDYSKVYYINSSTKVKIICKKHGDFKSTPNNHLFGKGCSQCKFEKLSKDRKLNISDFINKSKKIHGDKYDYSKVNYINNKTNIIIICKKHGEFLQKPAQHLFGRGCSKCGILSASKKHRSNIGEFIGKSKKIHGNKYDYSMANYVGNKKKIRIVCKNHGEFLQRPDGHLNGKGCPKCSYFISKPEIDFLNYCKISNTQKNRQIFIKPFKIDGYTKSTNTIYEFLGDYWHGNPEKYDLNAFNSKCHQTFGELYDKTILKFLMLKDMGYKIKYIWESDWKNFNRGIDKKPKILSF